MPRGIYIGSKPVWQAIPTINAIVGTADSISLSQYLYNPRSRAITYSAVGSLPTGFSISGSDLVWNGAGIAGTPTGTVRASYFGGQVDASLSFSVTTNEDYDPATTRYIRAGATGSADGTDWTNAYTSIPASLTRGYTYFVADGSYGSYTFDDAASGTSVITLKKATGSAHGTSTGWDVAYGDGQATFGELTFRTNYHTIDGVTRNESQWNDVGSYGFRCTGLTTNSGAGTVGSNITVRYCDIGPTYEESPSSGTIAGYGQPVYRGFSGISNWTISRCCIHGATGTIFQGVGVTGDLIEYNWIGPGWGKEAIRGQYGYDSAIIRHNTFYQSSQTDPNDGTSGITAEIGIWDGDAGDFDNNEIYGNVFYNTKSGGRNACILVGGDGAGWVGAGGANTKVWNNTFAGMPEAGVFGMIDLNGSTTSARNNLFYDTAGTGVGASTTSNNIDATTDPFVNYAAYDFHIEAASDADGAGVDLGTSPYDVDRDNVSREGNWSVGAYEVA